jgi:phosphoserine aminotransferase
LNLIRDGKSADYINTGSWSTKAIEEAVKLGKSVKEIASSKDDNFSHIPGTFNVTPGAEFLHITSNNTIFGTQWQDYPDTGAVPLVADMSSDIGCRPFDVSKFGLIYAGAQKNIGPSGVTLVIIKDELLERSPKNIPTMTSYKIIGGKESLYNTPPTFAIYIVKLVMNWLKNNGGLSAVGKVNQQKADLLYSIIDGNDFYRGTVRKDSRSIMNVTFRLPSEDLEKKFVSEAKEHDMIGLKGHRSVGGIRASIYNAVPLESVKALSEFMNEFARKNG